VIAKLDRLSRNLAFVATLMESGVEFVAADMLFANKLTIHILAAVAEHEREAISGRTKVALAAAKARGKRLGAPGPGRCRKAHGQGSKSEDKSIRCQRFTYHPRNPERRAHKLQRNCSSAQRPKGCDCSRRAVETCAGPSDFGSGGR
jgi:DNA invertase Pin-like site-specific DNA recombinase